MNVIKYTSGAAGLAAVGLIAGCTTTEVSGSVQPANSNAPATSSTSPPHTGPLGTTMTVTDSLAGPNGDQTAKYKVTVERILQDATPDNSFDAAPSGQHLVGVEIKLQGVSGTVSDSSDNDVAAIGSNDQTYDTGIGGVAAGTDFNEGQFNLSPGTTLVGWETFDVPNGVTIAKVQWTPSSGMGDQPVTWTVGG